jgi:hypothetical protein
MDSIRRNHRFLTIIAFVVLCFVQFATVPTRDSYLKNYDHGYQLGAGVQVLYGKIPGVDILTHYGPMVFYSSAAWYRLSHSLLGETIACAVAYTLCLTIVFSLVSRHVSTFAGVLAAGSAYLLEARFYKWYIWLFPLGTVWLLDRVAGSTPRARRWWIALTGLWVGLGWLYRWDVGTTGAAACLFYLVVTTSNLKRRVQLPWKDGTAFVLPFVVLPLAWFVYLFRDRGTVGLWLFARQSLKGAVNLSRAMALPMPHFDPVNPLSPDSVVVLAYGVVIATYLACGIIGMFSEWDGRKTTRSRLLLGIALVGLSTFHQGIYRKGAFHLLQIIPPAIVGFCVLASLLFERIASSNVSAVGARAVRYLGLAFLVCAAIAGLGLLPAGRADLSAFRPWPRQRLRELAHPLDTGAERGSPLLSVLRQVRAATNRDDRILVFPIDSQYLALLDRPVSGRLTVFVPGFFDLGIEMERNLRAIRESMPKVVLVTPGLGGADLTRSSAFHHDAAKSHAYMLRFIEENFTRKLHECDRCIVLARNSFESDRPEVARGQRDDQAADRR